MGILTPQALVAIIESADFSKVFDVKGRAAAGAPGVYRFAAPPDLYDAIGAILFAV
jgi:hypothetical protein